MAHAIADGLYFFERGWLNGNHFAYVGGDDARRWGCEGPKIAYES